MLEKHPTLNKRTVEYLFLGLLLSFLLFMMLRNVTEPLLDRHSWRQVDTASFARGLAQGKFDVLHPKFLAYYPDAFGIEGATETEFNLYPLIVAGLYRLFGIHEVIARLVSIAFSLGTAIWVYLLGKRYLDQKAGLFAVLFLGLSPLYIFYSRTVQPEATVLFFSVGALYTFTRWLRTESWTTYAAAILCAALAFLTKLPALYMGIPLLFAAFQEYRWRLFREWRIYLFGLASLLPVIAYYLHAHGIYRQTGLTVYGISGGWPGSAKFDIVGQLASLDFYRVMLVRLRGPILGPYGLLFFLAGLAIAPRSDRQSLLYVWLMAVLLFILAVPEGNRQHEYYQLPLLPVASLFIGKAISVLLDPNTLDLDLILVRQRMAPFIVAVAILLNARQFFVNVSPMYAQETILLDVAEATARLTPPDAPVAILHDWARVPEVFYYAHRRGWSLWLERTPEGEYGRLIVAERTKTPSGWQIPTVLEDDIERLERLRAQGASSLVVSLEKGTRSEFLRSKLGKAISDRYTLLDSEQHWLIYDLTEPLERESHCPEKEPTPRESQCISKFPNKPFSTCTKKGI